MLVVKEYRRRGRRVAVLVGFERLDLIDFRGLAEDVVDYILNVHSDDIADALELLVEECLREKLRDVNMRRRIVEGVLREAAGEGLVKIVCRGDECAAVIDTERAPEPSDWDEDVVQETIAETLDESEARDELYSEVLDCIVRRILRCRG